MLRLRNVSRHIGGIRAVDDVSLDIPPGRITGLIGPNGAGKTTIVNLITGMMPLTAGSIHLGGTDITRAPAYRICRAGLARTFQNMRLMADETVIDNVMIGFHRHDRCALPAALLNLPSARRMTATLRRRAAAMIAEFGMERFAGFPAGGLSYGHQRRVEIMRALASDPAFLLLDEPIAGMNDVEADALAAIFRRLAAEGRGILLIEHDMRFVASLCDHVHVLDGGRLIAGGRPAEVLRDPAVIAAYLGG